MNDKAFKIFVDFDGTITTQDIGEAMFLKFGDTIRANEIIEDWIEQKINARESWQLLCNTVKNFEIKQFENFLVDMKIDSTFKIFNEY